MRSNRKRYNVPKWDNSIGFSLGGWNWSIWSSVYIYVRLYSSRWINTKLWSWHNKYNITTKVWRMGRRIGYSRYYNTYNKTCKTKFLSTNKKTYQVIALFLVYFLKFFIYVCIAGLSIPHQPAVIFVLLGCWSTTHIAFVTLLVQRTKFFVNLMSLKLCKIVCNLPWIFKFEKLVKSV